MKRHAEVVSFLVVFAWVMLTTSASAQYYTTSPYLPPQAPYVGPAQFFTFESSVLTNAGIASVDLYNLAHTPGAVTDSGFTSGNYWDTFNSTLTGSANINFVGGAIVDGASLSAQGLTTVTVMDGYTPGATGGWTTSLSIMNWPAAQLTWGDTTIDLYLQCPVAPGYTTVEPSGEGYLITSEFDVTPEISLDNSDWVVADQEGTMTLTPEPSSLALLGIGAVSLLSYARRRRTAIH